jgi:hypothetical protein
MNAFFRCNYSRTPAAIAALAMLLSACGGGGGASPELPSGSSFRPVESSVAPAGLSAGANCDIRYTITQHPALSGADPLLPQQWHLRNLGQTGGLPGEDLRISGAWALGRGEGVTVAVVDDAIELVHPDLAPNVVPGSVSFRPGNAGGWPVPCLARDDDHGTAAAALRPALP